MGKCLVTKLNGRVSNDELLKLGEMRFYFQKEDNFSNVFNHAIGLTFSKETTVSVFGGNFVDKTDNRNLGTTINFEANIPKDVFVSNDNCYISVNKYLLSSIHAVNGESKTVSSFCIDDLKYSKGLTELYSLSTRLTGDIANLKNLTALTNLSLSSTRLTGDIANLKNLTALTNLRLSSTQVTGDIVNLKNLTALTNLNLSSTQVTGDIVNLKNLTALTNLNLSSTQVTGDIAAFINMSKLYELRLNVYTPSIIGELSSLPTNLLFYSANSANKFTWSGTRSTSYSIIALEYVALNESIDKALNDLANCTNKNTDSNPSWYKVIKLIGTRTSASDAAVQTLQSKGYTVSITPA